MADPRDASSLVREIEDAGSRPRVQALLRALGPQVARMPAPLKARLVDALSRHGLPTPAGLAEAPSLAPGEAWLLLATPSGAGLVTRLVATSGEPRQAGPQFESARLGLLAVAGRACRALPHDVMAAVVAAPQLSAATIEGRSGELAAAVALLSLALGKASLATVAGTAQVESDGTLRPVHHVEQKLAALRRDFPLVRTLVIATGQSVDSRDVTVVACSTLDQAVAAFGLDVAALPASKLEYHFQRASAFARLGEVEGADYPRLRSEAWETAMALRTHDAAESARCQAYAALFALHAGDARGADALIRGVNREAVADDPHVAALVDIVAATTGIDTGDLAGAEEAASRALALLAGLRDRGALALVGRAQGTLGRVYLHGGAFERAIPLLEQAAEHHERHVPAEGPRSRCYLATAVRLAGRYPEALRVLDAALARNKALEQFSAAAVTERYLRLERGRVLLKLERLDEAETDLFAAATGPGPYPRLGADRSLVRLYLRAGKYGQARRAWASCSEVLAQNRGALPLARVAAIGLMEMVAHGEATAAERAEAERAWCIAFGEDALHEARLREIMGTAIF